MSDSPVRTKIHSLDDLAALPPIMVRALQGHAYDLSDDCWQWTGGRSRHGYGVITVRLADGRMSSTSPHRVAYMTTVGPIPPGMTIDHICRNRACFNPAHLRVVSLRVNRAAASDSSGTSIRTRMETGRCRYGHEDWRRRDSGPDTWECMECNHERGRMRSAAISAAHHALGLTYHEYIATFGQSGTTAQNIITSLDRGMRPEVLVQSAQTAQQAGW